MLVIAKLTITESSGLSKTTVALARADPAESTTIPDAVVFFKFWPEIME
jgi:hypothetical protein